MYSKIAAVTVLFCVVPATAEESVERLSGHRAVYELSFGSARPNAGIVGAEGRYVFDLEDACEGYALNERLVVRLARANDGILTDYRLSAFETSAGDSYRFSTETAFDGQTGQAAEGSLTVGEKSAQVAYNTGDDLDFDEPVLTPVAHLRAVLDTARAGGERHAATIFDGDRETPVFLAVTRITPVEDPQPVAAKGAEALDQMARWAIDSVYYQPQQNEGGEGSVPQFAFSAMLFENGIVDDLTLDYMDFSLKGQMSSLELREPGC